MSVEGERPRGDVDPDEEPADDVDRGDAEAVSDGRAASAPLQRDPIAHELVYLPSELRRNINRGWDAFSHSWPMLDALAGMRRQMDHIAQQVTRVFTPQLDTMLKQVRQSVVLPQLQSPQWQQTMARVRELGQGFLRYWPENWKGVRASDIEAVLRVAKDEGLPLVWVPRADLVKELLNAEDADARRALLEKHAEDIVADCAALADREFRPELVPYAERLRQVVDAYRSGMHAPGQALAAVVVTALLQWVYGHGELRRVKTSQMRAKERDEQMLRDLKVGVLIEAAVFVVRGGMDKLRDDELADGFNRHATLHRVAAQAYTVPNAICALILATGLLAEAQQLLEDDRLTT